MSGENSGRSGDEINSTAGDNASNMATGKRIEQDNRNTGANYYNYAAREPHGPHLTLDQRLERIEETMADLIDSLYGHKQKIRDGDRKRQEGDRLEAIEHEIEKLKNSRPLPISFNTALLVVILIILFFALLFVVVTWLQNSGPKTIALSLLQLIAQAAPYWRAYTLWPGLISF